MRKIVRQLRRIEKSLEDSLMELRETELAFVLQEKEWEAIVVNADRARIAAKNARVAQEIREGKKA